MAGWRPVDLGPLHCRQKTGRVVVAAAVVVVAVVAASAAAGAGVAVSPTIYAGGSPHRPPRQRGRL